MRADLNNRARNGKIEPGKSPFDHPDFIRMDGKTMKLANNETGNVNNAIRLPKYPPPRH